VVLYTILCRIIICFESLLELFDFIFECFKNAIFIPLKVILIVIVGILSVSVCILGALRLRKSKELLLDISKSAKRRQHGLKVGGRRGGRPDNLNDTGDKI